MANIRISFIGDSLVAGTGDPAFLGWAGRISTTARKRGHDISCYNLGVRGNTSANILSRWRSEAQARFVAAQDCRLVFAFGINDTKDVDGKRIVAPDQAIRQATEILAAAIAWLPTLMIGPPPIADEARNPRIADLSVRLSKACEGLSIPYLASFDALRASTKWIAAVREGDGVHPGAAGYEEWARAIEAWPAWRAWVP